MTLERLRERLSDVDCRIVDAIAERQAIVAEIGATKIGQGRPVRDFAREKEVVERVRAHAHERGVDPEVAEEIVRSLIRSSLAAQEHARVAASGTGNGKQALVIGGAGKMGRWLVDFLDSQGYKVDISDPAGPIPGFGFLDPRTWNGESDTPPQAPLHDLVVVSAPLAVSCRILERLADLRPPGLIFDVGSLKTPLQKGLDALVAAGCRVTSIHPMFGPGTRLLSGRHVLLCPVGDSSAVAEVRTLFESTMAVQIEMSIDEHDRLVAFILGLSHALNIAFFTALAESGEDAPRLAQMSSTTFDAQLQVASAVAHDNPHLYFEIQTLNEHGEAALQALENALGEVTAAIRSRNEERFVDLMKHGRAYLENR